MLFYSMFCTLLWISIPSALARIVLQPQHKGVEQIPIGEEEVETFTFHVTTTRTRFEFEFYTKTMTREYATAEPTPTSYGHDIDASTSRQRSEKCDETACAICTWYYSCQRGTPDCFRCDNKSYCECGY